MKTDSSTAPRPLAITMGDACGIGPEIIVKAAAASDLSVPFVVFGDAGVLERSAKRLGSGVRIVAHRDLDAARAAIVARARTEPGALSCPDVDVVECSQLPASLPIGTVDARAGAAAHAAIVAAARAAQDRQVRAVVTAPIHKEAMRAAGVNHPGHTELLAELAGVADVRMMLVNDELRTMLVTVHEAMRDAIALIDHGRVLRTIELADAAMRGIGIARPRIAVAGLNPHAGEGGLMGREEIDTIAPAIADARACGIDASGPWPGDTIFMRARGFRDFDLVVAMYHDQGLIPIKYLGLDEGVNVTVGLPFVRTSVDHGTAFDIAGRGIAEPRSLLAAMRLATQLTGAAAPR